MKKRLLQILFSGLIALGILFPAFADEKANYKAEYDKLFNAYNIAFQDKNYDKMDELMPQLLSYAGKPGTPRGWDIVQNIVCCLTWRNDKRNNESLKRAYELGLPTQEGDNLVFWLQRYGDFLRDKRMASKEDIQKVLDKRCTVKGVSNRKLVDCYLADGNIAKAESLIPAVMKEFPNKAREEKYKDLIDAFSRRGLPAANTTKKLYEEYIAILSGDQKAEVMGKYATLLKSYALADDATIAKVQAERYNVPGITDKMLMRLYFSDISKSDEKSLYDTFKKGKALAQKSPELKNQFYLSMASIYYPPWSSRKAYKEDLVVFFADFPEKEITGWTIHSMRTFLVDVLAPLDYDFTLALLKKCTESDSSERQIHAYSVMADFYKKFSERMYETPDTVQLRRAIACQEKSISLLDASKPLGKRDTISARVKLAEYAYLCKDYNLVREQVRKVLDLDPQSDIVKYLGFIAYDEENYAETVRILTPLVEKRIRDARTSEYMVRALCALKRYAEADKLVPYMIDNNARSGKSGQYRQEQRHLKIRAKEQEKLQNSSK